MYAALDPTTTAATGSAPLEGNPDEREPRRRGHEATDPKPPVAASSSFAPPPPPLLANTGGGGGGSMTFVTSASGYTPRTWTRRWLPVTVLDDRVRIPEM